jgi:hypothetical protein
VIFQHIEKVFKHKELELQLVDAKLAQANLQMTEEKERNIQEKQQVWSYVHSRYGLMYTAGMISCTHSRYGLMYIVIMVVIYLHQMLHEAHHNVCYIFTSDVR